MPGLVIVCGDDLAVAHDGSEGVSPEGWLPDRVSIGALTKTFPPELVDQVVDTTGTRWLCQPELAPEFSCDLAPRLASGRSVVLL